MTAQELLEIVANGKSSGVESERDNVGPAHLAEEIVAFANFEGGMILLGVNDDDLIEGVQRTDIEQWLMNICSHNVSPAIIPWFQKVRIEGETVVVLRIPKGAHMQLARADWNPELLNEVGLNADQVPELGGMLNDFLDPFRECYQRSDQRRNGEVFIKGVLSDLDRKSIEPIALHYEVGVRGMQLFMENSPFTDARMTQIYKNKLSSRVNDPKGMLSVDSTELVKKGNHSVGVARQHCGRLGKTDNCQSVVFIGYASDLGYGLVNYELFMPEKWFTNEYEPLRKKCCVPDDVTFKTKPEMAGEMLKDAFKSGLFKAKWIGCDSLFGASKTFLDGLPEECWYFADIHCPTLVWRERPEVALPEYSGRGKRPTKLKASFPPVPVSQIATDDSIPWERVILAEGSQGPIVADVKVLRVIECQDNLPGNDVWLYIRRFRDGKLKFSLSNAPADTPKEELHRAATLRWPIEQCFEETKSFLGMDHCEARSWTAWHRHIMFVLIAHLFILEVRQHFKKTGEPVLTLPQAQRLIIAGLSGNEKLIRKTLKDVNYYMKRNMVAHLSHRHIR